MFLICDKIMHLHRLLFSWSYDKENDALPIDFLRVSISWYARPMLFYHKNAFQLKTHHPLADRKSITSNSTLEWPWPQPTDLDTETWTRYDQDTCTTISQNEVYSSTTSKVIAWSHRHTNTQKQTGRQTDRDTHMHTIGKYYFFRIRGRKIVSLLPNTSFMYN